MTRHRRRPDGLAAKVKARPNSNKAHLALRARYRGGELTIEARERTAIFAVVVLLVVFAAAAMVVAVSRDQGLHRDAAIGAQRGRRRVGGLREVDQALDRGRAVLAAELGVLAPAERFFTVGAGPSARARLKWSVPLRLPGRSPG